MRNYLTERIGRNPLKIAFRVHQNSEWHFRTILWSYVALSLIALSTYDWFYLAFTIILICLLSYGEYQRQRCEILINEIKSLHNDMVNKQYANIQTNKR